MHEEDATIQCQPPRTALWQWLITILATVAVFGGIIFIGLLMIFELATNYQTTQGAKLFLLALSGVLSIVLLLIFVRWEQDRWYWALDEDKLIGGKKKDKIFPLSSIETIVPGLPEKTNLIFTANKYVHPELWASVMIERKLALLLKFSDGSFMPFHVHRCVNGCQLMTGLVKRLTDRLDRDYEYTRHEIKALRSADWNRIVKQRIA
jgi:hypothetical protein